MLFRVTLMSYMKKYPFKDHWWLKEYKMRFPLQERGQLIPHNEIERL